LGDKRISVKSFFTQINRGAEFLYETLVIYITCKISDLEPEKYTPPCAKIIVLTSILNFKMVKALSAPSKLKTWVSPGFNYNAALE